MGDAGEDVVLATGGEGGAVRARLEPVPGRPCLTRLRLDLGGGAMVTVAELAPEGLDALSDALERAADRAWALARPDPGPT